MQTYNQFNQGNIMPLLMNFTTPTPIEDADDIKFTYNDGEQISYEMRTISTRCLRNCKTKLSRGVQTDKVNELDDRKSV